MKKWQIFTIIGAAIAAAGITIVAIGQKKKKSGGFLKDKSMIKIPGNNGSIFVAEAPNGQITTSAQFDNQSAKWIFKPQTIGNGVYVQNKNSGNYLSLKCSGACTSGTAVPLMIEKVSDNGVTIACSDGNRFLNVNDDGTLKVTDTPATFEVYSG